MYQKINIKFSVGDDSQKYELKNIRMSKMEINNKFHYSSEISAEKQHLSPKLDQNSIIISCAIAAINNEITTIMRNAAMNSKQLNCEISIDKKNTINSSFFVTNYVMENSGFNVPEVSFKLRN